jgi:hypothetical protein
VVEMLHEVVAGVSSSCEGGELIAFFVWWIERMLRVRWKLGEWSRSNLFVTVSVVASGSVSKVAGARGASPADGLPVVVPSHRSWRVFIAALFKAS